MSSVPVADPGPPPTPSGGSTGWRRVRATDGTWLAWRADGPADAPVVVLCNGIACDEVYWDEVWGPLAREVRVVRWHYRAHGRSDAPADPAAVTVADCASDLVTVLDAAGAADAVLVGHSFGVQVACETYRRTPRRVAGIVAVAGAYEHPLGTVAGRDPGTVVFPLLAVAAWPAPGLAFALLRAGLRSPLGYWIARVIRGAGPQASRSLMRRYFRHAASLDPVVMLRMFRAMQEHSAADVLPAVAVPTTVLAGGRDGMTPPRVARRMAATVPGARLIEIPRATHVLPVEFPEVVVDEVRQVVARTTGPDGTS